MGFPPSKSKKAIEMSKPSAQISDLIDMICKDTSDEPDVK